MITLIVLILAHAAPPTCSDFEYAAAVAAVDQAKSQITNTDREWIAQYAARVLAANAMTKLQRKHRSLASDQAGVPADVLKQFKEHQKIVLSAESNMRALCAGRCSTWGVMQQFAQPSLNKESVLSSANDEYRRCKKLRQAKSTKRQAPQTQDPSSCAKDGTGCMTPATSAPAS